MYLLGKSLVGFGHFGEDAGVLLGNDGADNQQRTDHQGHSDQQVDKHVLDQTGQDEADVLHQTHGKGFQA